MSQWLGIGITVLRDTVRNATIPVHKSQSYSSQAMVSQQDTVYLIAVNLITLRTASAGVENCLLGRLRIGLPDPSSCKTNSRDL